MLFIKFKILDSSNYNDFQRLFFHMNTIREFRDKYEVEKVDLENLAWDDMNDEEMKEVFDKLDGTYQKKQEEARFKKNIPDYANTFLMHYLKNVDNDINGNLIDKDIMSIWNYLEFGFEVNMDSIKKINNDLGIVKFSTCNYPFGGMDRFLITLKSFNLIPIECFNGFSITEFDWKSNFEFVTNELPEKTEAYLSKIKK